MWGKGWGVAGRQLNFTRILFNIFLCVLNIRAIYGFSSDQFRGFKKDNDFLCKIMERLGIPRHFVDFSEEVKPVFVPAFSFLSSLKHFSVLVTQSHSFF